MPEEGNNRNQEADAHDGEVPTRELFQYLRRRANRGDRDAAARLARIIRDNRDIWKSVGHLTQHAEDTLLKMMSRRRSLSALASRTGREPSQKAPRRH